MNSKIDPEAGKAPLAMGSDCSALSQSERFIAKARELGLDEREEVFDAALKKVARHKQAEASIASETKPAAKNLD